MEHVNITLPKDQESGLLAWSVVSLVTGPALHSVALSSVRLWAH